MYPCLALILSRSQDAHIAHLADEAALVSAPGEGVVEGPVPRPQGRRVRADGAAAQPDRAAEVRVARS